MSGRIYDMSGKAICTKCGSDCWLSNERNFWGPKCKNIKCGNESLEFIEYDESAAYPGTLSFEIKKLNNKDKDGIN